ncbi:MAG: hypothetical protein JWR10_417 [Rubritepida sp.]|nr:hypothetical protein [Rubritepida sp.]
MPMAEFTETCAAVVEGIRRVGLFITSDPNTYRVQAITHGVASNPADAQEVAMRDCGEREGGRLTCRLRQQACGAR